MKLTPESSRNSCLRFQSRSGRKLFYAWPVCQRIRLITSPNAFSYKMAIGLKGSAVCSVDPLPFPTLVGLLVFPIHSLVAQSDLEFLVDEMFDCELPRRLVLQDRRVVVGLQWFIQVYGRSRTSRLSVSLSINCRIT
jgi:hypothetical protein